MSIKNVVNVRSYRYTKGGGGWRNQIDKVYFISYFLIETAKHAFVMGQGLNIANNLQGFSLEITRHRLYFLATLCCPSTIHGYLALLNQDMTDIDFNCLTLF